MRRNSHPKKLMMTVGRIIISFVQLLITSAAFAQNAQLPGSHSGIPYIVDGLALGARLEFESPMYRSYQCSPSEQFSDFTRCQRTQRLQSAWDRRYSESSNSILHSRDGTAVYINRNVVSVSFDRNEIQSEIKRLSIKFGEHAREMRMPQREGFPNAVIASWGKVQLEQLDTDAVSVLASGRSPRKGLLIDYLGDLKRSAQLGLPIYSLNGGAGYLWAASVDRSGHGHLRFLTVDPSALIPTTATQPALSENKEPEKIGTEEAKADAEPARAEAEKARVNSEVPTADTDKVKAPEMVDTDVAAAKGANLDALLARLESVLTRGETATHAMETLAYRANASLIAFLIIVAVLLLVWRAKVRSTRHLVLNRATYPEGIHTPQRILLEQKSVASQDTTPEAVVVENELKKETTQFPVPNLRPCIHCSREISIDDKFCMYCGASVASKETAGSTRLCSFCRNEIDASDKFCRHCGASSIAVAARSMTVSSEGSKETIAKRVQATRKRTTRKKAVGPTQGASSQPDAGNLSG